MADSMHKPKGNPKDKEELKTSKNSSEMLLSEKERIERAKAMFKELEDQAMNEASNPARDNKVKGGEDKGVYDQMDKLKIKRKILSVIQEDDEESLTDEPEKPKPLAKAKTCGALQMKTGPVIAIEE